MRTDRRWLVGVDVGGTNVVVALVPFEGGPPAKLLKRRTRADQGAAIVVARIASMIREVMLVADGEAVQGVGIGVPGPVTPKSGSVQAAPNLGWRDLPLATMIGDEIGLPVTLENDANCAAYGEWWLGAGQGAECLVAITLGTGVGGGVIIGGDLYRGASGGAGELGHTVVDFSGRECACGSRGCVEAYASGPSIAKRAAKGVKAGQKTVLTGLVNGIPGRISAEAVCEVAQNGDRWAGQLLNEAGRALGVAVANLINVLNPDVIVIGGGVAAAGDLLFEPVRAEVQARVFPEAWRACEIVPAELPGTAGAIGAAGLFKRTTNGRI